MKSYSVFYTHETCPHREGQWCTAIPGEHEIHCHLSPGKGKCEFTRAMPENKKKEER